jgi:hypothetical protein
MHASRKGVSYKPKLVHTRVLARKLAGKSNRQIAREEGIDQHTVARILSQSGYDQICDEMRKESVELLPDCVRVCARELAVKGKGSERVRVALDFLHGHGILVNREQRDVKSSVERFARFTDDELDQYIASHMARYRPA